MHRPGIEPGPPAWQASILPLNHRCLCNQVSSVKPDLRLRQACRLPPSSRAKTLGKQQSLSAVALSPVCVGQIAKDGLNELECRKFLTRTEVPNMVVDFFYADRRVGGLLVLHTDRLLEAPFQGRQQRPCFLERACVPWDRRMPRLALSYFACARGHTVCSRVGSMGLNHKAKTKNAHCSLQPTEIDENRWPCPQESNIIIRPNRLTKEKYP